MTTLRPRRSSRTTDLDGGATVIGPLIAETQAKKVAAQAEIRTATGVKDVGTIPQFLRQGDTVVLSTAVMAKEPRAGIDWFPLTCDYEEKLYAAGTIPGAL